MISAENTQRRLAVVTGGLGGLGTAICQSLAAAGNRVVAVDLGGNTERIAAFDAALAGSDARFVPLDVTDFDACRSFAEAMQSERGGIDILVNAAGITRDTTLRKMD